MQFAFEGIQGAEVIYDDLLLWFIDEESHDRALRNLLERAWEKGVKLKKQKCEIKIPKVVYHIYVIRRPRHLFKTRPGIPSVCLKPAFNQVPAFINGVQFSVFFQGGFMSFHFFILPDKLSLYRPTRMIIYLITKVQDDTATVFVVILQQNTILVSLWGFIKDKNSRSNSVLVLFRYCCDTSTQSKCLCLSSSARSRLILIKGMGLDYTPGPQINARTRLNAPGIIW